MPELIALAVFKTTEVSALKAVINNQNRLIGHPRTAEFERSLRTEVRDPLWMLCRQWQFGEFQGEDAATAFQASILGLHSQPNQLFLGSKPHALPYSTEKPLETVVEREALKPDLYLRVQLGRQLLKFLKQYGLKGYAPLILQQYPLSANLDEEDKEGIILSVSVSGRLPDGYAVLMDMNAGVFHTWVSSQASIPAERRAAFQDLANELRLWYKRLYEQPQTSEESAWSNNHLEYQFALDAGTHGTTPSQWVADQYANGRLEWHAFDQQEKSITGLPSTTPTGTEQLQTFIPTPLTFGGMPHPRLWQMEDNRVDFGKLDSAPTNLLNVLLAEYGLTYSNDWFILPYLLKINTICEIKGILVKDVFGLHFLVEPSLNDPEMNWQEFAFFHHTERQNSTQPHNRFYLTPAVGKTQEGDPIEKVNFMRDEMANMVWAIENTVPSEAGNGRTIKLNEPRIPENFTPADDSAVIRYILGSTVPDNWIPFIPVHKKVEAGQTPQEFRLQRARLPQQPGPKSRLLSEVPGAYFIEEEEVPRAGVIVQRSFQRTRWLNGKTFLWLGRQKVTGRGEGWSGLMFDQILPIER